MQKLSIIGLLIFVTSCVTVSEKTDRSGLTTTPGSATEVKRNNTIEDSDAPDQTFAELPGVLEEKDAAEQNTCEPIGVEKYGAPRARIRFKWENDSWFTESDRFFTNGIGLGIVFEDGSFSNWFRDALTCLPFRGEPSGTATEFSFRQDMFTPENFKNPNLIPNDRPYAGWLHFDIEHQILTIDPIKRDDHLDTWKLEIGIVGPKSLAEDAQVQVHKLVNAPEPRGWDHQLKNEVGIIFGYHRNFRAFYDKDSIPYLESDFIGKYGVKLGNVETSAHIGGELRTGINLPRHFGSAIRPTAERDAPHSIYLTAGVDGRIVARNIFLDGITFRTSHDVDRNNIIAQFKLGVVWEPCDHARISILEMFATPEFDSPSQEGDVSHFTSVQVELFF